MHENRKNYFNVNIEIEDCGVWFYVENREKYLSAEKRIETTAHSHPWFELQVILEGALSFVVGDTKLRVQASEAMLTSPAVYHSSCIADESGATRYIVAFELYKKETTKGEMYSALTNAFSQGYQLLTDSRIVVEIKEIVRCLSTPVLARKYRLKNALQELLFVLAENGPGVSLTKKDYMLTSDSTDVSYTQLATRSSDLKIEEKKSLKEFAAALSMGQKQVNAILKSRYGLTFKQKQIRDRLEKVQEKLLSTDKSVEEVATEEGFNNLSFFYKTFKAYAGCTPRVYRKQKGKRNATEFKQEQNRDID